MEAYTVIDMSSGEIKRDGVAALAQGVPLESGEGLYIGERLSARTHYFAGGKPVAYTESERVARSSRPDHKCRWDVQAKTWVDLRTDEQREADAVAAVRRRRAEQYPSIGDQLDMLWHAMRNGDLPKVEPFYYAIQKVKADNPLP